MKPASVSISVKDVSDAYKTLDPVAVYVTGTATLGACMTADEARDLALKLLASALRAEDRA